jgi:2,4-dienoyl-CoA reductase-like NADH-dependent reductase (Old Yellow Enzyme family)
VIEEPGRQRYPNVFSPLKLGPVEVPNRIYIPPHGIPLEVPIPGREAYGEPAAEHAYYFAERAAGGVGLIFHSLFVTPSGRQAGLTVTPWFEEATPAYARLAELVHEQGAKIMGEIYHAARSREQWEPQGPDLPTIGAAIGQQYHTYNVRREMTRDEIKRYVDSYTVTTRNLRNAGYDGIEVHASHGVLVEHFLSPYYNRREDEYGGSLENRCRMLIEALEAVRSELGADMALGIRINADELVEGGLDEQANRDILAYLATRSLLDYVDLDVEVGSEQGHLMITSFFEPKLHNAAHVAAVSPAARPSMVVLATPGRVTQLAEAERLIASGSVDMVGINRGNIAEPRLVQNALEGKESRSRTCIAANHCAGAGTSAGGFGCAVNPAAGHEERWGFAKQRPAAKAMRVVVVGGGPAGLEAARVAAVRGHSVTLFERRSWLGGGVELWSRIPGREHLATYPAWFTRELRALDVRVETGVEVEVGDILVEKPDVVFVATGSRYSPRGESGFRQVPIPGWEHEIVLTPDRILEEGTELHGTVVILDEEGMHAAVGVAEIAGGQGATVEYVTRSMVPARAIATSNQLGYVMKRLIGAGVRLNVSTYVTRIDESSVTLVDLWTGTERAVEADTVVLGTMREPVDRLSDALRAEVEYAYLIGDALAPRGLREATYEGNRLAFGIGEPDMPKDVFQEIFAPIPALRSARAI